MKTVLFIFPRNIFPIIGGDQIRAAQFLKLLILRYKVFVLYLSNKKEKDDYLKKYIPELLGSKCIETKISGCILRMFKTLINHLPFQVNYYSSKDLRKYLIENYTHYDIIFSGNPRVSKDILNLDTYKVVDFVDAASMNCYNAKKRSRGLKRVFYTIEYYLMRNYEILLLNKFDRCSIISKVDKQFIDHYEQSLHSK
ncbi:MAG: hypothetical protein J1F67_12005 [Muribaculaceae bacterium]|nr:hypothetical protein [Muribaculaceae bacterium]